MRARRGGRGIVGVLVVAPLLATLTINLWHDRRGTALAIACLMAGVGWTALLLADWGGSARGWWLAAATALLILLLVL